MVLAPQKSTIEPVDMVDSHTTSRWKFLWLRIVNPRGWNPRKSWEDFLDDCEPSTRIALINCPMAEPLSWGRARRQYGKLDRPEAVKLSARIVSVVLWFQNNNSHQYCLSELSSKCLNDLSCRYPGVMMWIMWRPFFGCKQGPPFRLALPFWRVVGGFSEGYRRVLSYHKTSRQIANVMVDAWSCVSLIDLFEVLLWFYHATWRIK